LQVAIKYVKLGKGYLIMFGKEDSKLYAKLIVVTVLYSSRSWVGEIVENRRGRVC